MKINLKNKYFKTKREREQNHLKEPIINTFYYFVFITISTKKQKKK